MKPELELPSQSDLDIVEAAHWMPPHAPMEMPEQQLERPRARAAARSRARARGWRFWPSLSFRQRV
ncbi:hypothetical protein JI664_13200 [Rhodobacter sp. NTK016B]|uniref:hypothetical protein n=1 Tax=Rhodobacter sp. NTK016B TaxID=2759676 RepID=UPI001A8EC2D0|nr:hypothetical protein [Rhodobacter sp. NTK016B]MBN8292923.1 hypothetical protein [Rhodobacter sp. NTK016B]